MLRIQCKDDFFSSNSTVFQTSEDLKPKDLSKLARKIRADNMKIIAIEQFEMDDNDIDIIAANCRDKAYEFNFEILKKWKNLSPENNRMVRNIYRPQTKLREGNVFTPVWFCSQEGVSVHWGLCPGGLCPRVSVQGVYEGSLSRKSPPVWCKSGWYTSYWNAFLFYLDLSLTDHDVKRNVLISVLLWHPLDLVKHRLYHITNMFVCRNKIQCFNNRDGTFDSVTFDQTRAKTIEFSQITQNWQSWHNWHVCQLFISIWNRLCRVWDRSF